MDVLGSVTLPFLNFFCGYTLLKSLKILRYNNSKGILLKYTLIAILIIFVEITLIFIFTKLSPMFELNLKSQSSPLGFSHLYLLNLSYKAISKSFRIERKIIWYLQIFDI